MTLIAKQHGFTLIELMIVVVIVSVLGAIAMPSYQQYIAKARRTDARSALLTAAQGMEKFYTEKLTYKDAALGAEAGNIAQATSPDKYYDIRFDEAPGGDACAALKAANDNSNPGASAFRICAVPTGSQSSDKCGTLSIDNQGVKLPSTAGCWR